MRQTFKNIFLYSFLLLCIVGISLFFSCGQKVDPQHPTDLVNIPATSDDELDKDDLPEMEFEEEVFDFGTITQGENVSHVFKFTNSGSKPLIIANAYTSCGCTVPEVPKHAIEPGKSSEIKVMFNSEGKSGLVTKEITLMTNCIPNKRIIKIKANIFTPQSQNQVKP